MRISYVGPGKRRKNKYHVSEGDPKFYVEANRDKDARDQVREYIDGTGKYKGRILPGHTYVQGEEEAEADK